MEVVLDSEKTMNNSTSTDRNRNNSGHMVEPASKRRRKYFQIKFSPPLYQTVQLGIVPVSFITLPILIDELWKTFVEIGGEPFRLINSLENKNIFKKVMLTLAKAKVCCAQRTIPVDVNLPQREQFLYHELVDLNLLVKQLPYPLAVYLDCLGNTVEGKLNITPVLAKCREETNASMFSPAVSPTSDEGFDLSDGDTKIFKEIVACFDDKNFNARTDLLKGQGRMAQTVQTPEWFVDRPFRYFTMTDIPEHDQQLGATFGFGYTCGKEKQRSRYGGRYETAYWQGEVIPQKMLKSMLDENPLFELQEAQEAM